MSIKSGLYEFLKVQAGLVALVQDRIYPSIIPEEVFDGPSQKPCLTWERTGIRRDQTYCVTESLTRSSFRLTAFATSAPEAQAVTDAALTSLLDYSGPMGVTSVRTVLLEEQFDGTDLEPGLFRVDSLIAIWHSHP